MIPALIGGGTLLSDGALTPAVTVTSAIEGLKSVPLLSHHYGQQHIVILTTLITLTALLVFSALGQDWSGKFLVPLC